MLILEILWSLAKTFVERIIKQYNLITDINKLNKQAIKHDAIRPILS